MTGATKAKMTGMVRAIAKLPDHVPESKVWTMVRKTMLGVLFQGLSCFLLWFAYLVFRESKEFSLPLVIGGVCASIAGASVWSGQLVHGAVMAPLRPFLAWRRAVREDVGENQNEGD